MLLKERWRLKMAEALAAQLEPERFGIHALYIFGSAKSATAGPGSDIDLLVIKETSERFIDRWVAVRHLLSDPSRTIPLEVIVLTPQELSKRLDIGDQFLKEIIDQGEVLYAA